MKCPTCREDMHPVISGPEIVPKIGGDIVHMVCPECDSYLSSVPVVRSLRLPGTNWEKAA
jgi:hypothetical protein